MRNVENGIFELKKNAVGRMYFVFKNAGSEMVAVSQSFSDRSSLEACITNIRNCVKMAPVLENITETDLPPFFKVQVNSSGHYNFYMLGLHGERLMSSEDYDAKEQCIERLAYFKVYAQEAKLVDLI